MSETPNHGYDVPDKGTQDWHTPINGNFEALEVDVELRDAGPPSANGYSPADGAKYLDTTTGLVYLADGNTWTQEFDLTGGGGGGGISSLSGGEGIDPGTIGDGDIVSVAWGDASGLNSNGVANDFTVANDLDNLGNITDFSGATSLDSNGNISDFSGATSLDSSGTVNVGRYLTSGSQVEFSGPAEWSNDGATATNTVSGTAATAAGGFENEASANYATVAGGDQNTANAQWSTVGGGDVNEATGPESTVAGGYNNSAGGNEAAIGGGQSNTASAAGATVSGGTSNTASGSASSVAGGEDNSAGGDYSFAAGRNATASNDGAFVVGDSTSTEVTSQVADEARFQGEVVSESFIETGSTYEFTDNSMLLSTFEDSDSGNDVFAVSVPGIYGGSLTQLRVNEFGDTVVTGDLEVQGSFNNTVVDGDLEVKGDKNFVQPVETDDGEREVVYTASEAAEARTEASGVVTVEDGRAVVELPDHFGWVTSDDEPLVVQTTPYASEPVQPQVTERSTDRIVIEDFAGVDEYEVAYTVKGTRAGHEDKQVVREPTATGPSPAPADDD